MVFKKKQFLFVMQVGGEIWESHIGHTDTYNYNYYIWDSQREKNLKLNKNESL